MGEEITGYDGEVIAEIVDYHNSSGKYLGTAFEEKGCLELLLMLWLPIAIMMMEMIRG